MKRIGILGSRNLSCKILEWMVNQNNANIVGVVVPPFNGWWNDRLKQVAKDNKLQIFDSIEELLKQSPDILFSINYWKTISKEHINLVKGGIVNIHHSYLLKYRGRYSTSWAIANARKLSNWQHGTTIHYISPKLDAGPIIDSYKCDITESDTAKTLFSKVESLAFDIFINNFQKIINNAVTTFLDPDPEFIYYDKDSNKNLEIEYGTPIEEIYDFIRAWTFDDRPLPYFNFKGKKILVSLETNNIN
jgi:methionyl-tRNA formyltransferase